MSRIFRRSVSCLVLCLYLIFPFSTCHAIGEEDMDEDNHEVGETREGKNLFPFVWVTFQPSPCGGTNIARNESVCVQRGKCARRGGIANGMCQNNFGDCCTFTETCNATRTQIDVTQVVTILETPATPSQECSFRFRKEPNICQIRLDFAQFEMASANEDSLCDVDRLRISNTITVSNFVTCGVLTDQHMYLTFGSQDTIEITPLIRSAAGKYRIVATKIPCDSTKRAPDYCLQYFTAPTGQVRSFDFRSTAGQQQGMQQYTACVKPQLNSESIQWRPCPGVANAFNVISPPLGPPDPNFACTTDWVQLKGDVRRCLAFPQTTSNWKPYELLVNFDATELPPPPAMFEFPVVDPANCAASCEVPGLDCSCDPAGAANQTCLCIVPLPPPVPGQPAPAPPVIDLENRGFCLEYTQM